MSINEFISICGLLSKPVAGGRWPPAKSFTEQESGKSIKQKVFIKNRLLYLVKGAKDPSENAFDKYPELFETHTHDF